MCLLTCVKVLQEIFKKFCWIHTPIVAFAAVEIKRDKVKALKEANNKKNYEVLRATPSQEIILYFYDNTKRVYSFYNDKWNITGGLVCQFKKCWKMFYAYEKRFGIFTEINYCFSHLSKPVIDLNDHSPIEIVGDHEQIYARKNK